MLAKIRLWLTKFRNWWQKDFDQRKRILLFLFPYAALLPFFVLEEKWIEWFLVWVFLFAPDLVSTGRFLLLLSRQERLVRQLGYPDPEIRRVAFEGLLFKGREAIPLFLRVFSLPEVKRHVLLWDAKSACVLAAEGLGRLKAKEAVPVLVNALKHKDPLVRAKATWALGEIRDESAITALIPLLGDTNPLEIGKQLGSQYFGSAGASTSQLDYKFWVSDYAAEALEKLGKGDLAKAIRTLLVQRNENSLKFLRERYRNETITALMMALESPNPKHVANAAWALGELGAVEAIPKLKRVVRKLRGEEREICMKALAKLETISRLPAFPSTEHEISKLPRAASFEPVNIENLPSPAQPDDTSKAI